METKKVLTLIFSIIFVGAFAFCLTWGIINFNKVKDGMSGTGVYTQEDINNAYNDGYDTALKDKNEYTELIAGYRDTITTLNDNISQLNSQVNNLTNNNRDYANQVSKLNEQKSLLETQVNNLNTIKTNNEETISALNEQITNLQNQVATLQTSVENKDGQIEQLSAQIVNLQNLVEQLQSTNRMNVDTITSLNVQIANLNNQISEMTLLSQNSSSQIKLLNNKINELQASVNYYENYIAQLENGEQVVATFEFDGSVYNIQIVNKGSKLSVINPTNTAYKVFNGWTIDGQTIDLNTYTINQNVKIVADITYKYEVKFMVDENIYNSQFVIKDNNAVVPSAPVKENFIFDYWTINGVDEIDVSNYQITENIAFIAKFSLNVFQATFLVNGEQYVAPQSIVKGNYVEIPETPVVSGREFAYWTLDGVNEVDLSSYQINENTTFIARFKDWVNVSTKSICVGYNTVDTASLNFIEKTDTSGVVEIDVEGLKKSDKYRINLGGFGIKFNGSYLAYMKTGYWVDTGTLAFYTIENNGSKTVSGTNGVDMKGYTTTFRVSVQCIEDGKLRFTYNVSTTSSKSLLFYIFDIKSIEIYC